MKVLSSTYFLPQSINATETNSVKQLPSVPSFRAGKLKIEQELSNSVYNSIKANGSILKDILENPNQRKTFFATLGSIIVSTAAAITQAINVDDSDKLEKIVKESKKESDIKFETVRGKCPQIEKDIIAFTDENFREDSISVDKIKLLFNEYCGKNRNGSHFLDGQAVANKVLIKTIFEEIKANYQDKTQLYHIISKYMSLGHVDNNIKSPPNSGNTNEKTENTSDTQKQESKKEKQIEQIKTLFNIFETEYQFDEIVTRQCLKNLNKNFADDLDSILFILHTLDTKEDKISFITALANKTILQESVKTYNNTLRKKGLSFLQYNNFKILNLDDVAIEQLTKLIHFQRIKNVADIGEANSFVATFPGNYSINNKFQTIQNVFEIIASQQTTLSSHETVEFDKNILVDELKSDFKRNGNRTTYKNLINYLYGNKHELNCLKDFEKHQYDTKFETLISLLNNEQVFNNNLFSNHSKLRFIERYVLTDNSAYKNLNSTTKKQIRHFIESLKRELENQVKISPYYADEKQEKIGVQVRFQDPQFGLVKITLNNEGKMHTII